MRMPKKITATRWHDISCGHRVVGHENKCRFIHGHNYRVHFTLQAIETDEIGRVMDFGVIKSGMCQWLEDNWDHKLLLWDKDPLGLHFMHNEDLRDSVVFVPFNPTAENMAEYLFKYFDNRIRHSAEILSIQIDETAKCSASYSEELLICNTAPIY